MAFLRAAGAARSSRFGGSGWRCDSIEEVRSERARHDPQRRRHRSSHHRPLRRGQGRACPFWRPTTASDRKPAEEGACASLASRTRLRAPTIARAAARCAPRLRPHRDAARFGTARPLPAGAAEVRERRAARQRLAQGALARAPPRSPKQKPKPKRDDMRDEIPFVLAGRGAAIPQLARLAGPGTFALMEAARGVSHLPRAADPQGAGDPL